MQNATKRFKIVPEMEGVTARWYARQRGSQPQLAAWRKQATQFAEGLPDGADVLEVAPGPGFLAIELARFGRFHITGLDISRSFVQIARENARKAAVDVEFRQGDATGMPFDAESFDLIICQAAFKNFARPRNALDEMHRVLRDGGTAVIQDMSRQATAADIDREVNGMDLSRINAFATKWTLTGLRRRAYSPAQFERLAGASAFRTAEIHTEGIGLEVRLIKHAGSNGLRR